MAQLNVSVVYADADGQVFEAKLTVSPESCIGDVIAQSAFFERYPSMSLKTLHLGVFGVRKTLSDGLHEHDRVEIYRPLLIDPKERRRATVDGKRSAKKWRQDLPHKSNKQSNTKKTRPT